MVLDQCPQNVAGFFADQGDLPRAESLVQENLKLSAKGENKNDLADALDELAELLVKKSQLTEAQAKCEQALAIYIGIGNTYGIASDRLRLANVFFEEGRLGDVEAAVREEMGALRKEESFYLLAHAHTLLARALLMGRKLKEATTEIGEAKALWEKGRDFQQHFDIGIVRAQILAQNHDPTEAERQLNRLLDESTSDGLVSYQFEIRLALGEIEMNSGKMTSGVAQLKSLEKDATAKGFLLIAQKARAAGSRATTRETSRNPSHDRGAAAGRQYGYPGLQVALEKALDLSCFDVEALRLLLTAERSEKGEPGEAVEIGALRWYDRTQPSTKTMISCWRAPDAPIRVVARGRNWRQVSEVKAKRLGSAVTLSTFPPSSF